MLKRWNRDVDVFHESNALMISIGLIERKYDSVLRWRGARDKDIDSLVALKNVAADLACFVRAAVWIEIELPKALVKFLDVINVKPEVVISCQERSTKRDERPSTDKQDTCTTRLDGSEEVFFFKRRPLHFP